MNIYNEEKWINAYCKEVQDLMQNEKVKEMKTYHHHGKISTHFHSVFVSYTSFKASVKLGADVSAITRASLLHDFYLYDWHITKHEEKHAWYHPKAAAVNIEKYIGKLTPMQKDMVLSHMWPLHKAPKSLGGYILTFADKHCANLELCGLSKSFMPIYNEIVERTENCNASNNM